MATDHDVDSIFARLRARAPLSRLICRSGVGRRPALILLVASGVSPWPPRAHAQQLSFKAILAELSVHPELVEPMRRREELDASAPGLERAPLRTPKSAVPISQEATDLLVTCEVSSPAVYESKYQAPVWPKGESGLTIGVGYDIGQATEAEFRTDWGAYLPVDALKRLSSACGITGTAAATFVNELSDIKVGWRVAQTQFAVEARPRYVGLTLKALPNSDQLNRDTLGALVSLVYNRGASFSVGDDRHAEMRAIKKHMGAGELSKIPGELRSMKRLWIGVPDMRGVVLRREAEAQLFESGLKRKS